MKNFIDNQIELSIRYQGKLRSLKQCSQLLKYTPGSTPLLSMHLELRKEAADIFCKMGEFAFPEEEVKEINHGVVGIGESYYE